MQIIGAVRVHAPSLWWLRDDVITLC